MKHIFIAFSPKDSTYMLSMRENLLRVGYKPWIDTNPRPGQDWRFDIDDAIRSADAVVVIVTPSAAESIYVTYEWAFALGLGMPVIPVVFRPARMHPRLNTLEHFDFASFTDERHFWDYFVREIQRLVQIEPHPQAMPALPPQPHYASEQTAPPVQPQPAYTRQVMPSEPGFYLVVRRGPRLHQMFKLDQETITLGRDGKNTISIDDPEVSRNHFSLVWNGNGYTLVDSGSTNGTRINGGARVKDTMLQAGDALMLGDGIILSYEVIT